MSIEQAAVDAVSRHFSRIERVELEAASNDRTPFTDGHIDLYETESVKPGFLGRIPIQIKGRVWRKGVFPEDYGFSMPLVDARAYLKLGGVIYFVALIGRKDDQEAVYARMLSPSWLRRFVLEEGAKVTSTVRLRKIPEDERGKLSLLSFALEARKETEPIAFDPVLFDPETPLTIFSPNALRLDQPLELEYTRKNTQDFSLFGRTREGLLASVDGEFTILPPDYVEHYMNASLKAGGVVFDSPRGRRIDVDTFRIILSECLTIDVTMGGEVTTGKVNLAESGSLASYLPCLEFFVAALEDGQLEIDGKALRFEKDQFDRTEALHARKRQLTRFKSVFDALDVDGRIITIDCLDERSRRELDTLYRGLVSGDRVPASESNSGRIAVKVCGWTIELMCTYHSDDDSWSLENMFSSDSRMAVATTEKSEDGGEVAHLITPYDLLDRDSFGKTLNLNLNNLVPRYEALPERTPRNEYATRTLLELIAAADITVLRRDELLQAASSLCSWLLSSSPDSGICRINEWQISARLGGLSEDERREVYAMMVEGEVASYSRAVVGFACAILLGDSAAVSHWENQLSEEDLALLEGWPILNLRAQSGV